MLSILLTNCSLAARSGTELVVRELALALRAAGHDPMVYSPALGEVACEIRDAGIPVADDLARLPRPPALIHGHHHVETVEALLAFPSARAIFVCHDRCAWHDLPPQLERIRRWVAVDLNCRERLAGLPEDRVRLIHNWVDTERFLPREALPDTPRRALLFSNYAGPGTHLEAVQAACAQIHLPLDVIGAGSGRTVARPQEILPGYDLVFAKARCALEAMATGAAVVLCDLQGLGPMVTAAEVERLRGWNFGMRLLDRPLDPEAILGEIRRYHAADAGQVSRWIRQNASLAQAVAQYLRLYQEVLEEPAPAPLTSREELRQHLRWCAQALAETEALPGRLAAPPGSLVAEIRRLQAELDAVHRSLTWRLVQGVLRLPIIRWAARRIAAACTAGAAPATAARASRGAPRSAPPTGAA